VNFLALAMNIIFHWRIEYAATKKEQQKTFNVGINVFQGQKINRLVIS